MKMSWRHLSSSSSEEDVLIKTNIFALVKRPQNTSWRRLQDILIKTNIFVLAIRLQDVFKTSSRRLAKASSRHIPTNHTSSEYILKTSSRRLDHDQYFRLGHTSSKRPQDVFNRTSRRLAKMSSRRFQDASSG